MTPHTVYGMLAIVHNISIKHKQMNIPVIVIGVFLKRVLTVIWAVFTDDRKHSGNRNRKLEQSGARLKNS